MCPEIRSWLFPQSFFLPKPGVPVSTSPLPQQIQKSQFSSPRINLLCLWSMKRSCCSLELQQGSERAEPRRKRETNNRLGKDPFFPLLWDLSSQYTGSVAWQPWLSRPLPFPPSTAQMSLIHMEPSQAQSDLQGSPPAAQGSSFHLQPFLSSPRWKTPSRAGGGWSGGKTSMDSSLEPLHAGDPSCEAELLPELPSKPRTASVPSNTPIPS